MGAFKKEYPYKKPTSYQQNKMKTIAKITGLSKEEIERIKKGNVKTLKCMGF